MRTLFLFAVLAFFQAGPLLAQDFATKDEAVALVEKTEALLKTKGREQAIAEMQANPKNYSDRDLYVTIVDEQGLRIYHGQNPKLVGKSLAESVDVNGKEFGKEMMSVAKSGGGWVDYMFKDPVTQKVLPKTSFIKAVDGMVLVAGVYKR